jgi:hypothetical protein
MLSTRPREEARHAFDVRLDERGVHEDGRTGDSGKREARSERPPAAVMAIRHDLDARK